jgi:exosortase
VAGRVRLVAADAMSHADPNARPSAAPRIGAAATTTVALAGLLATAFYALFWSEWRHNPDLSHAVFTPILFVVLLHEARARGPWRWLPASPWVAFATALAFMVGFVLLAVGGLYAVALDWSHALVGFVLAAALAALLLAALLGLAGERVCVVPLNWPALAAIALWPLSAPIPPGTYTRLTGALQLWVTGVVLHALDLLGVPAIQDGNVLTLAHGVQVGVEEACSGVRSLVACVVAGIFFSATLVRRPAARVLLLVLAAPLALVMNVVRSLTLTLLANAGTDIAGAWHDWTGFAVLGVTAALLGGLAMLLETRAPAAPPVTALPAATGAGRWLLPGGLGLAAALALFFTLSTHAPRASASAAVAPDLENILPAPPTGWAAKRDDLRQFSETLETEHLAQRDYVRTAAGGQVQITIYLAWWPAGAVPVSLVESHTPEACWPGGGWVQQPTASRTAALTVAGRALPAPTYLFFKDRDGYPQHTWFWHLNAGRPIRQINPLSPGDLLGLVWREGFHASGEQLFVRVSSNQPWEKIAAEPLLAELFARLQPLGLAVPP